MTGADAPTAAGESFDLLRMDRHIQQRQTRRRLTKVAGWTGLIALSISRGGVLGWLLASGGIFGLVSELANWRDERPEWKKAARPVEGSVARRLLTARHRVPEGSELSFPASDPPATEPS